MINHLQWVSSVKQVWCADDASASGTVSEWWNVLTEIGPLFGYYPKAIKSVLLVKEQHLTQAHEIFNNTGISITTAPWDHLLVLVTIFGCGVRTRLISGSIRLLLSLRSPAHIPRVPMLASPTV